MTHDIPHEVKALGLKACKHYLKVLSMGYGERWALMVATQTPPGTKGSDRAFQEGRLDGNWLDSLPERTAKKMVREAKAAGISIAGKQYVSGLADKRGHMDPMAWVSDTADVKRVAKARNLNVQGIVNHASVELPPKKSVDINPKILNEMVSKEQAKNPGLTRAKAEEQVRKRHTPGWKKPK